MLCSREAAPVRVPTHSQEAPLSPRPRVLASVSCLLFGFYLPKGYRVTPHCGFDLHFSDGCCRAPFQAFVDHLHTLFGKRSVQILCPF